MMIREPSAAAYAHRILDDLLKASNLVLQKAGEVERDVGTAPSAQRCETAFVKEAIVHVLGALIGGLVTPCQSTNSISCFRPAQAASRTHRTSSTEDSYLHVVAGIRRIDIHSLRHAYASLMIAADVNLKALQIAMGHSSFRVTMDTYAHLVPGTRDVAVNRVTEIVLKAQELEAPKESGAKW